MHLQIAFIISVFGLCVTMPIFVRYFAYTNLPIWGKILGFILCLLTATLPIFSSRHWADSYGKYFALIEYISYFIYIFAVILFALTFIRDIAWIFLNLFKFVPSPFNPTVFNKINLITVFIALACSGWSLYEGTKTPVLKHLTLTSPKIQQERTIVVLSDLHISRTTNPKKIKAIVDKTNAVRPDIILLAGDIVDDDLKIIQDTTSLLSNLKAKEGVYFVSGNHEFYIGYHEAMDMLSALGLTSIENKKIQLSNDITLVGLSDTRTAERFHLPNKTSEVLTNAGSNAYILLVSHSPTPMDLSYDLQVSGHTHGGQIFPFHFFSWLGNHKLLAGFYPQERIYVSRGSGQWGPQMRFLAPSEITVLHLKQTK